MRRALGVAACVVMLLASACQGTVRTPSAQPSVPTESRWQLNDLPFMPVGTRKAVYDAAWNCIWIVGVGASPGASPSEYVTVTRVDVSTHKATATQLPLHVVQFYIGSVSLDSDHHLWMAWDRTLVRFDPSTHATASFALPSFASLGVHPSLYSGEGTFVAVTVDAKGEVWAAASKVAALFGFNSISHRWDRVIHLPWFPSYDTTLAEPRPGLLTVNGYRTPDDKAVYQTFAKIDTATGRLTQMSQPAWSYSLVSDHEAIFLGEDGALFKLDIDTGETTPLVSNAPVDRSNGRAQFALSRDGHLWFGMAGYRSLGLGELDMASAAVNTYPFPYIDQPGKQLPDTNHCANSGLPHCVPSGAIIGTEIEAVVVDADQNIWVVTDWPAGYLNDPLLMTPVIELKAIA